jgi:Ca2+-binding RTX toxin-like protein
MRLRIAAAALTIGLCTAGVAAADDIPPDFQNRPTIADCYNAVPTMGGAGLIIGGPGNDVIVGSNGPDDIWGMGGNDVILGLDGDDVIHGGDGNDLICAGRGDDLVQGGPDDDTVHGEPGDDKMRGGDGRDLLSGNAHVHQDEGDGEVGVDVCTASTEIPVSCL